MPMMIEPLVFKENQEAGGYMVNGDEEKIIADYGEKIIPHF